MHPFGVTTWPRGGWAGSRIAVGAEIVRFTGAFLRGRRFFSSLDVAIQSPIFLVVPSGGATRRRHLLSQQPRDLDFSFLAERRFPSGDVFRSYRADCFFREGKLPSLLGRLDGGVSFILPSSLVFPVYRWRQDSSRGLPFDLSYGFGKLSRGSGTDFSVYGVGVPSHAGFRRSSLIPSGGCSSFKAFRSPLSFSFTSRQGRALALASLVPDEEPFATVSSPRHFSQGFVRLDSHSLVYQEAESSRGIRFQVFGFPSLLSKQQALEEVAFPRSVLRSPHVSSLTWLTEFRPIRGWGVPSGVHYYTPSKTHCKHFFAFF